MATTKEFDPLAYIENAFLDRPGKDANGKAERNGHSKAVKFRKTQLSAPRPRRSKDVPSQTVLDPHLKELLELLPKNIEFLGRFFNDSVTSNYYEGDFKESREDLIRRLLDPVLTLEEASRLLGVCPATVRRYTNRGWLEHQRTEGGQRRFRLSHVVKFVSEHGRLPQD
ncbi:MAG: helix-turn-helix domain-containing protein [Fimbriimonadaceae bacterium]|jgi:excisionase family DNA binding protein|nr:helix-turn-helix domain-containing protein [Fimbriimonadaceae bacterium]